MQGESKTIGKGKRLRKGTYDRMLALAAHALAEVFGWQVFILLYGCSLSLFVSYLDSISTDLIFM